MRGFLFLILSFVSIALAAPVPVSPIQVSGRVDHLVVGPAGRVDGLLLQDHTFARFRPDALADPSVMRFGDKVLVRGILILTKPNRVLDRVKIIIEKTVVLNDSVPAPLAPATSFTPEAKYSSLDDSGRLFAVGARPSGEVDRLILQNGTVIYVPSGGFVDAGQFQLGQPISAHGFGTMIGGSKVIHALNIERADHSSLIATREGPREPWGTKIGTFRQVLMTPDGQIDGVLLDDNSAIRFSPVTPDRLFLLSEGAQVEAAGPIVSNQVRANLVFLPQQQKIFDLQPLRSFAVSKQQAGSVGRELNPLADMARVQTILRGPERQVETVVLGDGVTVRVPPNLQASVSPDLMVGDVVEVKGIGGAYPRGTGLEASSIQVTGYSTTASVR
jgi:hypothetical protein